MAIDTIKLSSHIDSFLADKILKLCVMRQGIDLSNGDVMYQITTGTLEGSFDSRISIKVDYVEPYVYNLIVECSVHKLILGHNVYGGSDDLQACVNYLHNFLEEITDIKLPFTYNEWKLLRIDNAEVYNLSSFETVQEWFRGINTCSYPRRVVNRYGDNGIHAHGSTTALKFYHKGPEFWTHDRKRFKILDIDCTELQERANKILRVEVGIKARKLKAMYDSYPSIGQIDFKHIQNVFDIEVKRFLKEGCNDMKQVKNTHDVERRLSQLYGDNVAGRLLGTWFRLSTLGEKSVKEGMSKPTYYRQIKQLKDAGISWQGTDVVIETTSLVPQDFSPIRTDIRCISGESKEMQKKLKCYRVA